MVRGSCHKDACAIFDLLLEVVVLLFRIDKHVCVKDSSVETCIILKTGDFFPI